MRRRRATRAALAVLLAAAICHGCASAPLNTSTPSLDALSGSAWTLREWNVSEPASVTPVVSLVYEAGRFTGSSGCNRYFATVTGGTAPGEIRVGPVGGTRMACPDPQSSTEARFLEQLGGARRFGLSAGGLTISYVRSDGTTGTMRFYRG
jgi:putative lipoprotein